MKKKSEIENLMDNKRDPQSKDKNLFRQVRLIVVFRSSTTQIYHCFIYKISNIKLNNQESILLVPIYVLIEI